MIAIAHFAGLVVTTLFAAAAAVLLDWLLLRAMFQLMRPATASSQHGPLQKAGPTTTARTQAKAYATTFGSEIVQGTRELVRHLGPAAVRR
jgi:hypothetical protein